MSAPDFEKLRAQRNQAEADWLEELAGEGFTALRPPNPDRCYCACSQGGPCEHKWDGKPYETDDGSVWSATCSRCGMTALGHNMGNAL